MDARKKVAIPTFGTRVSPRFDCARAVLVIAIDDGKPSERQELVASNWAPHERINQLLELGVDTVICGAIDCWSAESLRSAGVTIYDWVTGEIEDSLAALLRGDLDSDTATEAGGRWGFRWSRADDGIGSQSPGFQEGAKPAGRHGRRRRGGGAGGRPDGLGTC
jgi:predicted Fe-Mo cluster-binding NifX family protein